MNAIVCDYCGKKIRGVHPHLEWLDGTRRTPGPNGRYDCCDMVCMSAWATRRLLAGRYTTGASA